MTITDEQLMSLLARLEREGQQLTVRAEPMTTAFKTEVLPLYKTDFSTFNTTSWITDGTYIHKTTSGGGELWLDPEDLTGI